MFRVFVAAGFVCLTAAVGAAPIAAATTDGPYRNCKAAAADGRYDIPSDDPAYGPWLDRDNDGIGCES